MINPVMSASGAHFSVTLPGGSPAAQVLDVWEPAPPDAVSFAPDASGPEQEYSLPEAITWRAELPAEPLPAHLALYAQQAEIAVIEAALRQVDPRLNAFLADYHPDRPAAFSAGVPAPEQALAGWLQAAVQPVSFAQDNSRRAETQDAQGFLEQVRHLLSAYSWVETAVEGQVIACTRVSWTGDFNTSWSAWAGAQNTALHSQTVALALASRAVWVRFAGSLITGALRLGAQLATPGGAILALPGLWRYINDIIDDYRRLSRTVQA